MSNQKVAGYSHRILKTITHVSLSYLGHCFALQVSQLGKIVGYINPPAACVAPYSIMNTNQQV